MKHIFHLAFVVIVSIQLNSCSPKLHNSLEVSPSEEIQDEEPQEISIGSIDHIYSEFLNEEREIWVHVPASSSYGFKFPVVYLIDGEYHFESVIGITKANVQTRHIPEMIIVAIRNTDRYRDLTTSHVGDANNPSGGAEKFMDFIEKELIPYVDSNYPTMPHKTIIGHSLGGLVATHMLMYRPHIFDNHIAIDPSLSWGDQKIMEDARASIKERPFANKSIYLAIANTLHNDKMSFEDALEDSTTNTLHLRSIVEFSRLAKSNETLHSDWKYFEEEEHGTVPVIALHLSYRSLFPWFKFDLWNEFYRPDPTLSGDELVKLLVDHHNKISAQLRHPFPPDEYEINQLGYMFLGKSDFERALPFFQLNIENYPESANAYDSMGDYYNSFSDTKNALLFYKKSMEFGGIEGTQEKLEALQK